MSDRTYRMPRSPQPLLDADGRPSQVWHQYLAGIEDVSGRVVDLIADSTATTVEQMRADHNALLAALKAAGAMRRS